MTWAAAYLLSFLDDLDSQALANSRCHFLILSGTGMGQAGFLKPRKSLIRQHSLLSNERPRLAAMLF
jgi:hypothetical protein